MLKIDLHAHTSDDPLDLIPHSTPQLIDRAADLGYNAIAVTLHDRQLDVSSWAGYARERGVVLIPGVERTIHGRHLLLLNFPPVAESVRDFGEVRALKQRFAGLVVAPHPFYPSRSCLRGLMDCNEDLIDAVEFAWFYTRRSRVFNDMASEWARRHRRPLVGNSDTHRLLQLGRTYSLVDAEPSAEAVLEAVRRGRVRLVTEPIGATEAAAFFSSLVYAKCRRTWRTRTSVPTGAGIPSEG